MTVNVKTSYDLKVNMKVNFEAKQELRNAVGEPWDNMELYASALAPTSKEILLLVSIHDSGFKCGSGWTKDKLASSTCNRIVNILPQHDSNVKHG